jgi:hypothetical protein
MSGDGYRMGEMERIALANANTDLRSDLLSARQEIEALRAAGDALAEVVCSWHEERIPVEFLDPLTAWEEARREQ